ncbi:protease inhibitor I42 family protein [Streptomyces sp. NPDC093260]|uniref:protease inhibitor I42 family protein n=1 Tax=Streptomyces sp. NPDC093260 TaxID=3155073 RepID=UPI003420DED7
MGSGGAGGDHTRRDPGTAVERRSPGTGVSGFRGRAAVATGAALLALATGCASGDDGPTDHPVADHAISARVGERFTLTFDDNASTREHWSVADPRPDASVVVSRGDRYVSVGEAQPGASGHRVFTFEAVAKGSTRIVMLHCTYDTCGRPTAPPATPATTAPGTPASAPGGAAPTAPEPGRVTYSVTVE